MVKSSRMRWRGRVAYSFLVVKPEETSHLVYVRVDADILKLILGNRTGCWLDSSGCQYEKLACSCEHSNKFSGSRKCEESLH
jgi:hypothetical protein